MPTLVSLLNRLNRQTTRWAGYAATLLLASMLVVIIIHVVYRYLLGSSFSWTEELSRYMMVWMAFLYFPAAHKKGLNVSLDLCTDFFKGTTFWLLLQIVIEALILVVLIWCVHLSFERIDRGTTIYSMAVGIPMSWVYSVLPVSFALTAFCSLERLMYTILSLTSPNEASKLVSSDQDSEYQPVEI